MHMSLDNEFDSHLPIKGLSCGPIHLIEAIENKCIKIH